MASRSYSFSFNLFELFSLMVAILTTTFLVFLCGLYVGKRVQERRSVQEGQTARLPVMVVSEAEEGEQKESIISLLTELPAPGANLNKASRSVRRSGGTAVNERKGVESAENKQLSEASVSKRSEQSLHGRQPSEQGVRSTKLPPLQTKSPQAASPSVKSAITKSSLPEGLWGVQVASTRDKAAASAVAQQLRMQGHDAYMVKIEKQGEAWYRVRMGKFASLTEASRMAARLQREGKTTQAFVVSE